MPTPRSTIAMNAPNPLVPEVPEVPLGAHPTDQLNLGLASAGVQRHVWQSAYGAMVIETRDGLAFVNGARVASMAELGAAEA